MNHKYVSIIFIASVLMFMTGCIQQPSQSTSENRTRLSVINVTPQPGEYFISTGINPGGLGNKSKILLVDINLKECSLGKDICTIWESANAGDPGILINGTIKNEYDRDHWVLMSARAYNLEGERIGSSLDYGPICGSIAPYVEKGKTTDFEMHIKYRKDIVRIEKQLNNFYSSQISDLNLNSISQFPHRFSRL